MSTVLNKERQTFSEFIEMETIVCYSCAIPFAVPSSFKKNLQANQEYFYCPNGHQQHYSKSTESILKEKIDKLEKQKAEENQYFSELIFVKNKRIQESKKEIKVLKAKNTIKRKKLERVKNGVCPCCNRSFQNLMDHMKNQHPESL
jgi:hypothetical protein